MAPLDRSSPVPLYRQLEGILRSELADGSASLTELGLAERFGVSRYTVRQALDVLQRDGLIERQKKRGTFPATGRRIQQPLEGIYSFERSLNQLGLEPSSRVLSLAVIPAGGALVDRLTLAQGEPVFELARLRSAAGEPLVVETIWLPRRLVPGLDELDVTGSIYDLLRREYELDMTAADESIQPIVLDAQQARLLGVGKGSAAFFVERVSYHREVAAEVRHSVIRGDRYLYSIRLRPEVP